jgi:hypothetical protein
MSTALSIIKVVLVIFLVISNIFCDNLCLSNVDIIIIELFIRVVIKLLIFSLDISLIKIVSLMNEKDIES